MTKDIEIPKVRILRFRLAQVKFILTIPYFFVL